MKDDLMILEFLLFDFGSLLELEEIAELHEMRGNLIVIENEEVTNSILESQGSEV